MQYPAPAIPGTPSAGPGAPGPAAYTAHIRELMTNALNAQGSLDVKDTATAANLIGTRRVYARGAWTLHMLRHVIGDSAFFGSFRAYVADPRFRYRSATTEGFRSVCESVSGMDPGYIFDEWVYGEVYPRYSYRWTAVPAGGGGVQRPACPPGERKLPRRSDVSVGAYDGPGRALAVLASGRLEAGTHSVQWEGKDARGTPVASGTYFCRFTAGEFVRTRAMVLVR